MTLVLPHAQAVNQTIPRGEIEYPVQDLGGGLIPMEQEIIK